MIFKKDSLVLGIILGSIAPLIGLILFKTFKFQAFSFKETFQFMFTEPGFTTLSVALSLSLLLNALLFTVFLNMRNDYTAKGIFATTVVYGLLVLCIKTFG